MKNNNKKYVKFTKLYQWALLFCLSLPMALSAQYINEWDYHPPGDPVIPPLAKGKTRFSENGLVHTPKGQLKILLIFAQFEGDTIYNASWEKNYTLPDYDEALYSSTNQFNSNNTDYSLSNFYYQMSKHSASPFEIYGEIFPEVIPVPQPTTTPVSFSDFTTDVFDYIETNYPNFDWSSFDQRDNWPNFESNNVSSGSDNSIDYVVVSFRWNNGRDPWSTAGTPTYMLQTHGYNGASAVAGIMGSQQITSGGNTYNINTGYTIFKGLRSNMSYNQLFLHEFGHNLYDSPHYNDANGVTGNHFNTSQGWGMMSSGIYQKYCAIGWEQWWLGWNNINHDLSDASDNGWYTLTDFINTGDMMRVKIPNTDQNLWLEYHTGESPFEERVTFTSSYLPDAPNGLFAYVDDMEKNKNSPYIFSNSANGIKFIDGSGNYDISNSSNCTVHSEWYGNCIYNFTFNSSNPFSYHNSFSEIRSDYNDDGQINYTNATNAPAWSGGNEMNYVVKKEGNLTYDVMGTGAPLNPYTAYSVGSNPAIIEHQDYIGSTQTLSPIRLHGLKITVGTITSTYARIHVEYGYDKVEDDTRWTGNIELPENQHLTIDDASVTIDRSGTPSREFVDSEFGFCPYSEIILKNGSDFTFSNDGSILLRDNSIMTFENGSDLTINSGVLDVGVNCNLVFKTGTYTIINNDKIIINGNLTLKSNANLTISGSGYIKLNGNINAEPGATLTIQGVNQSTKLLDVQKKIIFDSDFASITIKDGKIEMDGTYAELYINSGVDNVTIDNVKVTSSSGSYNHHEGIDIRSNGNITVKNSTFEYAKYALYILRDAPSPIIDVDNCIFQHSNYGLVTYNSGVDIDGCTFNYNMNVGLYCISMDKQSYINNCTIKYQSGSGDYGLRYLGSSAARLSMYGNIINNNYYGVYLNGSFTTSFKCNTINHNTYSGIKAYNTDIYLANASGISAGNNQLYSNNYGIKIDGSYASFYLYNGYNELRSDTYCMTGTLSGTAGGNIYVNNNYWKTGGGAPISGTHYVLNGQLAPITLIDYSPNSSYTLCSAPDNPDPKSMGSEPFAETYDYRTVNTSLGNMPLNDAVNQILNTDKELGEVYDINTQYELLSEVLTNKLTDLNIGEEWYVKHTYNMFKSAMGKFENDANTNRVSTHLMKKMLIVIRKLQKDNTKEDIAKDDKKLSEHSVYKASLVIDEAHMLWYSGNYDAAITLLKKLYKKVDKEQQCEITKTICRINVDRAFIESNNTLEIDELLEVCEECNESKKSGTIDNSGDDKNGSNIIPDKTMGIDEYSLTIIPNPVGQSSVIKVFGYKGAQMAVYNSAGQIVFNEQLQSNRYSKTVSNTNLDEGIYMVVVTINGKPVQNQKMVVVK